MSISLPTRVPNEPAKFYINDILLPVTPQSFGIKQNPKNESDVLADGRAITRPKWAEAQTFTLEFIIPYVPETNICFPDSWHERKWFTDQFWEIEQSRDYIVFSIIYPDGRYFNHKGMLDSWDYTQEAENGSDWKFTLQFTGANPRENFETNYVLKNPQIRVGSRDYNRVS